MDLEHLNRTQIILLTLLTSFVTSIATGIVTVSLMNQAPPQVAATVNHVIEHTIEQVVPQVAAPAVKTVVVKPDDAATQSIATVQRSIIRIVASSSPDILVARGVIIDAKGMALTDEGSLSAGVAYAAILPNGNVVSASVYPTATSSSFAILNINIGTTTTLTPATFADASKLELGQTVIRIGGVGGDNVAEGVMAALPQSSTPDAPQAVEASITSATPGSVLIDLYGNVIGMITSDSQTVGADFYTIPGIIKAPDTSGSAAKPK